MRLFREAILALMIVSSAPAAAGGIIDVHSHPVFAEQVERLEQHGAALAETFPLPAYDVQRHLAFMDKAGIGTSLLSMPPPNPYFDDREEARKAAREFNTRCAAIKRQYPGRFLYCAALPLPDVEGAVAEAAFALDQLDADCVKIATNSRGLYLGDPALDPLMAALNEREAVIVTHPHRPEPVNAELIRVTPLPVSEYLAETTRAVLNLLSRNVLATWPGVKVVVPHCGAYLPLAVPRAKALLPAMKKAGLMDDIDWEGNLAGLYFDVAGTPSAEAVRELLKIGDASHILYGSDFPYQPEGVLLTNIDFLKKDLGADKELAPLVDDILEGNARRLFGLGEAG